MKRDILGHVRYLFWLLMVANPIFADAQSDGRQKLLTGVVRDSATQHPLNGVTIAWKDSDIRAQTDDDGQFEIQVPPATDGVITVRLLGYAPKEVATENSRTIAIYLQKEDVMLEEVVAIGYATVNRKDLTGSVSSVNEKQLRDIPVNSAAEALTGRLAGVQVTTTEGAPGADVQIKVRGGGSVTQDNAPLYIVDGVQVEDALNSISPQDITSVDVLKDAASTAIYGARGANGVVIITTKGGKEMKPQIAYSNILGRKDLANKLEVMQPYDFVLRQYERTRGLDNTEQGFAETYGDWNELSRYRSEPFIDWQENTFGNRAGFQTHNLSLTGGTQTVQYNLSVTSNQEDGIMLHSDFDRKLVNFRFDNKVTDRLRIGFNVRYMKQAIGGAGTSDAGATTYNMLRHTIKYRPLLIGGLSEEELDEAYYEETNTGNAIGIINPIQLSEAQYQKRNINNTNLNGYASYAFSDQFSFRTVLGVNYANDSRDNFDGGITSRARTQGARLPMVRLLRRSRSSLNNSNVLTYKYAKSTTHQLDILLGNEFYNLSSSSEENQLRYFPESISAKKALGQLNLGSVIPTFPLTYQSDARTVSFFNRINYVYKSKYLASFSVRADASSRFSADNRWGYFPSGSLAWRLSEESFMENLPFVSDMKIRYSYGSSGNDRIDDYLFLTIFNSSAKYALNEQIVPGYAATSLANKDLLWETTLSQNIGLDVSLFNSRLQLTADVYQNKVRDLLLNVPIPNTSGYSTQLQNIGNTSNRGIELQVNALVINQESFTWNTTFNISFNRNRIDKLSNQQTHYFENSGFGISGQPADYIVKVGQPVGTMYGFVSDGFYSVDDFDYDNATSIYTLKEGVVDVSGAIGMAQPGWMKLKDLDGNGIVNEADKTIIGNANPKFMGGLNQQFAYKNFDLSIFVNFVYGNKVYNANKIEFTNGYSGSANSLAVMNNRWKTIDGSGQVIQQVVTESGKQVVKGIPPAELAALNADATIWMPISGAGAWYPTSWAMEDGSFLRINNITLGYTLPSGLVNRIKINSLRVYCTVNNLALWANYSGYDPEVSTRTSVPTTPGVDYSAYPRSKTFIVGLNLSL